MLSSLRRYYPRRISENHTTCPKNVLIIVAILMALIVIIGCSPANVGTKDNEPAAHENMNAKEFSLLTKDGISISVSHCLCGHPDVCILVHGFTGSKHRPYITRLSQRLSENFDIIAFDFRGHGTSGGTCNGMSEFYDIKTVTDYAKINGYEKIALVGFSLGGIEGIYAAVKFRDIDALVTVGTPASAEAAIQNERWLFRMAGNRLGRVLLRHWVRLDNTPEFPKPVTVIDQVSPIPLLIVQGRDDTLVTVEDAEMLYQKAKEPKQLAIIEGMKHPPDLPEEFYHTVENWLVGLLRQ